MNFVNHQLVFKQFYAAFCFRLRETLLTVTLLRDKIC